MGPDVDALEAAVRAVEAGGVVVFPTETVWGMGGRPDRGDAVERIYQLKGRPADRPLQRLLASPQEIDALAELDDIARRVAERFMPGPLTLVLGARDGGTVGVRVPDHPVALFLLRRTGPLAATSANRSGEPTPADPAAVQGLFADGVDVYLDEGPPPKGISSTVLSLEGREPEILREGVIPRSAIEEVLGFDLRGEGEPPA